jgi:hypothetical protein
VEEKDLLLVKEGKTDCEREEKGAVDMVDGGGKGRRKVRRGGRDAAPSPL